MNTHPECEAVKCFLPAYAIAMATDGEEALQRAQALPFDFYVLDAELDGMAGDALCSSIREFDANTPMLVFYGMQSGAARGIETRFPRAQGFLRKPISSITLRATVTAMSNSANLRTLEAKLTERAAVQSAMNELAVAMRENAVDAALMLNEAKEKLLRAEAYAVFSGAGGTRANFQRLWPNILTDVYRNAG
jgi:DNA-binding response OmpR family regulator